MSKTVDNHGIGTLYATFTIHKTGSEYDLDKSNIGDAVSLSGNNEISHGTDGAQLLGRLEYTDGAGLATVQIKGIIRFTLSTGRAIPNVGDGKAVDGVVVDGEGCVYQAPPKSAIRRVLSTGGGLLRRCGKCGSIARGLVIAVYEDSHCDVLL